MKRRTFIKTAATTCLTPAFLEKVKAMPGEMGITLKKLLHLTALGEELEESPCLVGNQQDKAWLFALRRFSYPRDEEVITQFVSHGHDWVESDPVSTPGQYECPCAACAPGGEPVVAWSCKQGAAWSIQVTHMHQGRFTSAKSLALPDVKLVNPTLVTPAPGYTILACEGYSRGRFGIYVSLYHEEGWTPLQQVTDSRNNCFDPALAAQVDGAVYVAYSQTEGVHQTMHLRILDPHDLKVKETVDIDLGGELQDRVNLNTKPALAFDSQKRLWISWENNHQTSRLEDSDSYTGDRCCGLLCYQDGRLYESASAGRWLFKDRNDHLPTFVNDSQGGLYLVTRCGGAMQQPDTPFWKFRLSRLDMQQGWTAPKTFLETNQKGPTDRPALIMNGNDELWLAWRYEQFHASSESRKISHRATQLQLSSFVMSDIKDRKASGQLKPVTVAAARKQHTFMPLFGGRARVARRTLNVQGQTYTLLYGNLHEHSEGSYCWPAGCDGILHDDYRFALYSEGYDFLGITDHTNHMDEPYWRKSVRWADFYHDPDHLVALPAAEWTLSPPRGFKTIPRGVGHRNVIFASEADARKFVRNAREIYSEFSPETSNAEKLWALIHRRGIDCVAIPHHPADEIHAMCWQVHDATIEPVVELFQCRGNSEYPGCPRENNVSRHHTTSHREAFVDYALREKGYRMGFIGSGEHNNLGIGLAAVWVKEVSRRGILEALRHRRCYATTGDKLFIDFRVNGSIMGQVNKSKALPHVSITVDAVQPIKKLEILRNSRVIASLDKAQGLKHYQGEFRDHKPKAENDILYYYLRVTQTNEQIAWSSPVWIEPSVS